MKWPRLNIFYIFLNICSYKQKDPISYGDAQKIELLSFLCYKHFSGIIYSIIWKIYFVSVLVPLRNWTHHITIEIRLEIENKKDMLQCTCASADVAPAAVDVAYVDCFSWFYFCFLHDFTFGLEVCKKKKKLRRLPGRVLFIYWWCYVVQL